MSSIYGSVYVVRPINRQAARGLCGDDSVGSVCHVHGSSSLLPASRFRARPKRKQRPVALPQDLAAENKYHYAIKHWHRWLFEQCHRYVSRRELTDTLMRRFSCKEVLAQEIVRVWLAKGMVKFNQFRELIIIKTSCEM